MTSFVTEQERATIASYKICWILAKKMKPYSDAEIVKTCMVEAMEALIPDKTKAEKLVSTINSIPLSNDTATSRCEKAADAVVEMLKERLKEAEYYSLAIDESTDQTDDAQL